MEEQPDLEFYRDNPGQFLADLRIYVDGEARRFGDVVADFQRERFAALMPSLEAVAVGRKPPIGRFFWESTKGSSKDSDLAAALLWLLMFSSRLLHCQVGASDQNQADELRKAAKKIVADNEWIAGYVEIQKDVIVSFSTDSRCEIITADVAGSQGARPDVLILNELSCITKKEFAENLLDNAAKVPGGVVVIATNPGTLGSWQYQWRELARESSRWSFHQLSSPAPWLSAEEIEEARRRNSASRFSRLWGGIWTLGVGTAISPDDVEQCICLDGPMPHRFHPWETFAALDLGVRHDRSALCVLAVDPYTGEVRLADCRSWTPAEHGGQVNLQTVESEVLKVYDRLSLHYVLYDPWQAIHMAQRLADLGCRMVEFNFKSENDAMAKALMHSFRNRDIKLYRDAELISGLCSMSLVDKPDLTYKLIAPRDAAGHADKAFAAAMCLSRAAAVIEGCRYLIADNDLGTGGRVQQKHDVYTPRTAGDPPASYSDTTHPFPNFLLGATR